VSGVLYGDRVGLCFVVGATCVYVWIGCSLSRSLFVRRSIKKMIKKKVDRDLIRLNERAESLGLEGRDWGLWNI
jgi:hypothetical protein